MPKTWPGAQNLERSKTSPVLASLQAPCKTTFRLNLSRHCVWRARSPPLVDRWLQPRLGDNVLVEPETETKQNSKNQGTIATWHHGTMATWYQGTMAWQHGTLAIFRPGSKSRKTNILTSSPIITMAWEVTTPSSEESTWSFPPNLDKDVAVWVSEHYKHRKNRETALTSGIPSSMYCFPVKCNQCNKQSRFLWESQFETCGRVGDPRPICFHLN